MKIPIQLVPVAVSLLLYRLCLSLFFLLAELCLGASSLSSCSNCAVETPEKSRFVTAVDVFLVSRRCRLLHEFPRPHPRRGVVANSSGMDPGITIAIAFVAFAVFFTLSWVASARWVPHVFDKLSFADKGENCSRVNSQIHALVVVSGLGASIMQTSWGDDFFIVDRADAPLETFATFMAISLGYFAFDLVVTVYYRYDFWLVYVVHHIVASIPYYVYLFADRCNHATFLLATFLLVEFATAFMNVQVWLEKFEKQNTVAYTVSFYATYIAWLGSRVVIPVMNVVVIWKYTVFSAKVPLRNCLIAGVICGHLICMFCVSIFVLVLTPALLKRWRPVDPAVAAESGASAIETNASAAAPLAAPCNESLVSKNGAVDEHGSGDRSVVSVSVATALLNKSFGEPHHHAHPFAEAPRRLSMEDAVEHGLHAVNNSSFLR